MKVQDFTVRSNQLIRSAKMADPKVEGLTIFFTYRFINFEWKPAQNAFVPISFDCDLPYSELRSTYTDQRRMGS